MERVLYESNSGYAAKTTHLLTMTNQEFLARNYKLTSYAWSVLRRCERNLHQWAEHYCNTGELPEKEFQHWLSVARKTAARFGMKVYHQQDCRGCSLYLYVAADLKDSQYPIEEVYNRYGTACC